MLTFEQWLAIIGALTGILSLLFVYLRSRGETKNKQTEVESAAYVANLGANMALTKYIDERIELATEPLREKLEAAGRNETVRTRAMTRILRAIATQWPAGTPGPHLDPEDIAAIEETIPSQWLTKETS